MERSGFLVSPDDPPNPCQKPEPEPVFSHPYSCRPKHRSEGCTLVLFSSQPASFLDPHEHIVPSWPYTHSVNGHSFHLSICRQILVVTRFRNIGLRRGQPNAATTRFTLPQPQQSLCTSSRSSYRSPDTRFLCRIPAVAVYTG